MLLRLVLVVIALVLSTPVPAHAHGADAPDATNYLSRIVQAPVLAGLEVKMIEAGARLQLTNRSGRNVEVLGYQGEPYLEVRPDGVYENIHSPATYLNVTIAHVDPPAHADPTVPPEWKKVAQEPVYRWHDQRALPPAGVAEPRADTPQHIRDWTVPMRVDATPLSVNGVLEWMPPPPAGLWWGLAIVGAGLVALLGLVRRRITPVLAVLVMLGSALALGYGVSREVDAGNLTFGAIVGQLFSAQLWSTVTALAAIAAAVYALVRTEGDFAVALGGAAVGLFSGMVNAAVFHRAITPVPWDASLARVIIVAVIVLGGGACFAAMLRLRAATPPRVPAGQTE
ncbi:hypothetical protein [Allorhizocola rhizosphaerae]|uniref:hypothetical protein n=1 Tax=Allorhizocola rhizosphaerae TaxID=1872709 RepID=UPI000E3C62C0|nr:hypothetical protein [Allorhizocola rhizosphaerae]